MISVSTPPMSLGWRKKIGVPCAPMRGGPEDARALALEMGARGGDVGDFEADMVLAAARVLLEELDDRRVRAQRLDQLDLHIGRIDEAHAHALRGQVERRRRAARRRTWSR